MSTVEARGTATLAGVLREHAAVRGDAPCLIYEGTTTTYAELDERASRVASALVAHGVQPGDRVALVDKNAPACLEVMFGAAKCGAAYVPVNWRLAPREVGQIVEDCEPAVIFAGAEFVELVTKAAPGARVVQLEGEAQAPVLAYERLVAEADATDPGIDAGPDGIAVLMYTSGTTGRPKGVELPNRNFLGRLGDQGELWGYDETSVNLVTMPLFHVGGTSLLMLGVVPGGATVLMRDFDPAKLLALIEEHKVTNTLLVPAMIQALLMMPTCATTDWSTMRTLLYGSSPIAEKLLRDAMEVMRCGFVQIYGMTEHSGVAAALPAEDHDPVNRPELIASCGKPLPWVDVMIADPATGEAAAPGEVGEIWVRSDQLMRGYWRQPDQTAEALVADGWYRTGDAAVQDEDGYLYIRDRVKDMIISGGENVYPAEIENVLAEHPAVGEATVIGIPHPKWGETPLALIVPKPDAEVVEEDVIAFCRERLAGFKCPTAVATMDEFPRTASGKVLKHELREPYWAGHERRVS